MAGVDIAGLVLGILGTVDQAIVLCKRLHRRCKAYKHNPGDLETLIQGYEAFQSKLNPVHQQYISLSDHFDRANKAVIEGHLDQMKALFRGALETLTDANLRIERRVVAFTRSVSIASVCERISKDLKSADTALLGVNAILAPVDVTLRQTTKLLESQSLLSRQVAETSNPRPTRTKSDPLSLRNDWGPRCFVPPNPPDILLDFNRRDPRNIPATPEAKVKALLLESGSNLPKTVAMSGMSGVGKSCVLRALPHDPKIRERFPDGFYFLSLGMAAHKDAIIKQAIELVRITGGAATALEMERFPNVDNVLEKAAGWFQNRTWLLLVDDICDGNGIGSETLSKLSKVLYQGCGSAIVFTTRDAQIAVQGTNHVPFAPKDPLCVEARQILLTCAKFEEESVKDNTCEEAIQALLRKCSGLPVALAIVGRYVFIQAQTLGNQPSKAWTSTLNTLGDSALIRGGVKDYPELARTFSAALEVLNNCSTNRCSFKPNRVYTAMHRALSVLRTQGWMPLSVLRILWDLETIDQARKVASTLAEVKLVDRNIRTVNDKPVEGIVLHELIHKFAVEEAESLNEIPALHNDLLDRIASVHGQKIDEDRGCRQWWQLPPDDGYIFGNLSWHLIQAGKPLELLKLLLCPEWTAMQMRVGGYLQLETDFRRLIEHVEKNAGVVVVDPDTLKSLQIIVEAALLSSGYVFSNPSEIWFQLSGRLSKQAETSTTIATYLAYAEPAAETPWIKPVCDCLTAPGDLKCLITHRAPIRCIDTIPNDDENLVCGCDDGSIIILNTLAGQVTKNWQAHQGPVARVISSVSGTRFVSCSGDNTMKVWNAVTGSLIFDPVWAHDSGTVLALSPDDRIVLSTGKDESVTIWNVESCKHLGQVRTPHTGRITALTVMPSGTCAVSGGEDGTVQIWNINNGEPAKPAMKGHADHVLSVAVSKDEKRVVSGSKDGTARIWNTNTSKPDGAPLKIDLGWVTSVAITEHAHGETFVITGSSDTWVGLWNVADQERNPIRLRGHSEKINDLTLSCSGRRVVSCSNRGIMGSVLAWDIETAKKLGSCVTGHRMFVKSLAVTPGGEHVVSGSGDKTIRIWDLNSGEQIGRPLVGHTSWVSGVAVTADGKRVVSVSYDKTIRIWDMQSGTQIGDPLFGHESKITCLALSPDNRTLVTASYDCGTIWVWDISDDKRSFRTLEGHTREVLNVFVSTDCARIISHSGDETIRVWDIRGMTCKRVITDQGCVSLSKKEMMHRANEEYDNRCEAVPGLRCSGDKILRDRERQMDDDELDVDILATMECYISCWVAEGKTLCVGAGNGQISFLQIQM